MGKKQKIIHFKISWWNVAGKLWKEVEINKINITEMKVKHEVAKGRTDTEENRTRDTEAGTWNLNKRTPNETRSFRTGEIKLKMWKTGKGDPILDSLKI